MTTANLKVWRNPEPTPGPWKLDGTWIRAETDAGFPYIAQVLTGLDSVDPYECEANAYQIAAAPALVEALQAALPALKEGREYQGEVLEVIAQIERALHLARGGQ